MAEAGTKRCVVAYATRDHQYLWTVELAESATIADALSIARGLAASTLTTRGTETEVRTSAVGYGGPWASLREKSETGKTYRRTVTASRSTGLFTATLANDAVSACARIAAGPFRDKGHSSFKFFGNFAIGAPSSGACKGGVSRCTLFRSK